MNNAVEFFIKETAAHARSLPLNEAVVFLKGALEIAGDNDAVKELRGTYVDLSSADDQLELIASGQPKQQSLNFPKDGQSASQS